ncbi:MAG TPA: F0F1 ATP synthase subunit delta [Patescibacteria group bacterium]
MDLSRFFTTKAEAKDFSSRLSTLSQMLYKTDFQLESALMSVLGIQKKEAFLQLMRENSVNASKPEILETFINKLQSTITTLPSVSISLAFEPQIQTIKTVSNWLYLNLKKQILLDFSVDPTLIAGIQITYNGKFKDYSLKNPATNLIQKLLSPQNQQTPHSQVPNTLALNQQPASKPK